MLSDDEHLVPILLRCLQIAISLSHFIFPILLKQIMNVYIAHQTLLFRKGKNIDFPWYSAYKSWSCLLCNALLFYSTESEEI